MQIGEKNKMKDLISIVVPIYKVEKYLPKCIDSIINQTYKNLEIILVDDGSPDRCGEICDEYAKTDRRIKVIHKENGGVSDARNVGIDIANGEYLGFVDSDDYLEHDFCEKMHMKLKEEKVDWIACNFKKFGESEIIISKTITADCLITDKEKILEDFLTGYHYPRVVWGKLFKKEMLDKYSFKNIKIGEDTCCIMDVMLKTKSVYLYNYSGYNYFSRPDSASMRREFNKSEFDRLIVFDYIMEICRENFCKYYNLIASKKAGLLCNFYNAAYCLQDEKSRKEYIQNITKEINKIDMKKVNIPCKTRMQLYAIMHLRGIYNLMLSIRMNN